MFTTPTAFVLVNMLTKFFQREPAVQVTA